MNLHQVVRGAINAVNPDTVVTLQVSTGYTTAASGKRTPTYTTTPGVIAQSQGLSADEMKHLDSLNIQGVLRGFWLNGDVRGVDRPGQGGGDLITTPDGRVWLVVQIFETWDTSGWCHVAGRLQV